MAIVIEEYLVVCQESTYSVYTVSCNCTCKCAAYTVIGS